MLKFYRWEDFEKIRFDVVMDNGIKCGEVKEFNNGHIIFSPNNSFEDTASNNNEINKFIEELFT